ncbi:hypothetical protein LC065_20155 (plasmid) [Halobacillus litoralis]|uniref:hypothetical protein n=1 Tax=Halobacillus litoralis TaxID=45668 RepID=UPI001CFCF963|nr:hypothetical protein [Halobacillus litoralis]WLR49559.1 hypothetical protein LC065_20155 [Halobacillus litoralis]
MSVNTTEFVEINKKEGNLQVREMGDQMLITILSKNGLKAEVNFFMSKQEWATFAGRSLRMTRERNEAK